MEIRRLLWLTANEEKLRVHGIEPEEVEEVVIVDRWIPIQHERYPDQVRIIGPTATGRMLTIALEPTSDPTLWRPVTGWPAAEAELSYFHEVQ